MRGKAPGEASSERTTHRAAAAAVTELRPSVAAAADAAEPGLSLTPEAAAPLLAPSFDPNKGTVLAGRYRLEEVLGQGGMGVVYRAKDLSMPGVQVAIKLLRPEFRSRPDLLNVLRESVRKVRSLPHPNIAGVYSLDSEGQSDFVVMELLQGQTLQSLLDREYARGLPAAMARSLIADLCTALAYAHDHGVIHSDIKPSNIFVTPSGHTKIFDFDIARVLRGPTGYFDPSDVGAFTCAYATTEMARGADPDPRDDVYALACVVYEMLSGRHPFGGCSAWDARERGLQVKPLPGLRSRENRVLAHALQFEREERLANVEGLRAAFTGKPPFAQAPLPRSVIVVVVLVLGAAVVGWVLWTSSRASQRGLVAAAAAELDQARKLAIQATELRVDQQDEKLRRALTLLSTETDASDSASAMQRVHEARGLLLAAIAGAPRIARLGTTAEQFRQALQLCRDVPSRRHHCPEKPAAEDGETERSVSLRPFALDVSPVTNGEFGEFARATGYVTAAETDGKVYMPNPREWSWDGLSRRNWRTLRSEAITRGEGADALPVLAMDLHSARAYCSWKGKRLPTGDEWEYSVRGPTGRMFPWGDGPNPPAPLPAHALAVARLGTSGGGADILGVNTTEWIEAGEKGKHKLMGGSWLLPEPYFQRLALRRDAPLGAVLDASFRCATTLVAWPSSAQPGVRAP